MINKKFWLNKKVLITGHTGFKGGWLSIWMNIMGAKLAGYSMNPISKNELDKFDSVIFDPPRAGASKQCEILAMSKIKNVVAVSCNPITFARDAEILVRNGFEISWVKVIDQFRWSHHIEIMASFKKK